MARFREIREAQRPGNTSKEIKLSEETIKKYNALFADDFSAKTTLDQDTEDYIEQSAKKIRGQELVAGAIANEINNGVERVVEREQTKRRSLFDIGPDRDKEIFGAIEKRVKARKYNRKISADELIESTKEFLANHKEDVEKGYCEPYGKLLK